MVDVKRSLEEHAAIIAALEALDATRGPPAHCPRRETFESRYP